MSLPFFVLRLNQGKNSKMSQKWKFGYGGLWRILKLNAMHYGALIPLHTCCIRPKQRIKNEIGLEAAPQHKNKNSHFLQKIWNLKTNLQEVSGHNCCLISLLEQHRTSPNQKRTSKPKETGNTNMPCTKKYSNSCISIHAFFVLFDMWFTLFMQFWCYLYGLILFSCLI